MTDPLFKAVASLVGRVAGVRVEAIRPETRIEHDLGCTGEDAAELMDTFAREFHVNLEGFTFERYFGSEAGATPLSLLTGVIAYWLGQEAPTSLEPLTVGQLATAAARGRWADGSAPAT